MPAVITYAPLVSSSVWYPWWAATYLTAEEEGVLLLICVHSSHILRCIMYVSIPLNCLAWTSHHSQLVASLHHWHLKNVTLLHTAHQPAGLLSLLISHCERVLGNIEGVWEQGRQALLDRDLLQTINTNSHVKQGLSWRQKMYKRQDWITRDKNMEQPL